MTSDQLGTVAIREDPLRRGVAVDVVGEFDCSNTHLLRQALTDAVGRVSEDGTLTIEICGLRFLSVAAARVVLQATDPLRRRPGAVRVAAANPTYMSRLTMLGLHEQAGFVIDTALVETPSQA
jgi:anti-anti-sigma factor